MKNNSEILYQIDEHLEDNDGEEIFQRRSVEIEKIIDKNEVDYQENEVSEEESIIIQDEVTESCLNLDKVIATSDTILPGSVAPWHSKTQSIEKIPDFVVPSLSQSSRSSVSDIGIFDCHNFVDFGEDKLEKIIAINNCKKIYS